MQSLGRRYVQYINRAYQRSGSLWEGRYKSSAVQAETCLLACMRHIELNPVRAGMVSDPAHYRWPSYRHNSLGHADERLTRHPLHQGLGRDAEERMASYRALFRSELDDDAIGDIRLAWREASRWETIASPSASAPSWVCGAPCPSEGARQGRRRRRKGWKNKPDSGFELKEREMKGTKGVRVI